MKTVVSFSLVLLSAAFSLVCCQKTETQPAVLEGTWQLTRSGGGITGIIDDVPFSSRHELHFGPDSSYSRYYQSQLMEKNFYRLRSSSSGNIYQELQMKTTNTFDGNAVYRTLDLTTLTSNELAFKTQGGCPLISIYKRVSGHSSDSR